MLQALNNSYRANMIKETDFIKDSILLLEQQVSDMNTCIKEKVYGYENLIIKHKELTLKMDSLRVQLSDEVKL